MHPPTPGGPLGDRQPSDHYDYHLPQSAIAQTPAEPRDSARLLVDRGAGRPPAHRLVRDLPELLSAGDVLVVNDTRVAAARLALRKPTGGEVEVVVLEPATGDDAGRADPDRWWAALVRPSRRVAPGAVLVDATGTEVLEVGDSHGDGQRLVRSLGAPMTELMEDLGEVPLPPYITTELADAERYQTVYAATPTSVAAPTAGLHFTPELIATCEAAGAAVHRVQLSVGVGTFRPITVTHVEDHRMHAERYHVPAATLDACRAARRVVAVGTTAVRALESAASTGELEGSTSLYIRPGFDWQVVDLLLTNFHLPRSSLLVMIEAFCGPRWRELYQLALGEGYRFLSFGDAMVLERRHAHDRLGEGS